MHSSLLATLFRVHHSIEVTLYSRLILDGAVQIGPVGKGLHREQIPLLVGVGSAFIVLGDPERGIPDCLSTLRQRAWRIAS